MTKLIINCTTGETIERELNHEELAQQNIDEELYLRDKAQEELKAAERLAIAERIGLSADELKILLG